MRFVIFNPIFPLNYKRISKIGIDDLILEISQFFWDGGVLPGGSLDLIDFSTLLEFSWPSYTELIGFI